MKWRAQKSKNKSLSFVFFNRYWFIPAFQMTNSCTQSYITKNTIDWEITWILTAWTVVLSNVFLIEDGFQRLFSLLFLMVYGKIRESSGRPVKGKIQAHDKLYLVVFWCLLRCTCEKKNHFKTIYLTPSS